MKKEMKEREMKYQKSFASIPVMVIAGILSVHMMFAIAYIAPYPVA